MATKKNTHSAERDARTGQFVKKGHRKATSRYDRD
jgi:hypothetical protein